MPICLRQHGTFLLLCFILRPARQRMKHKWYEIRYRTEGKPFMAPTALSAARRIELLEPPAGHVRMVVDTDTYNEIDDQFALVYALLSPERMTCEAIYAAPFHNQRSSGPEDG